MTRVVFFKWSDLSLLEPRIMVLGIGAVAKECGDLTGNDHGYHKFNIVGFVPMPDEKCLVSFLIRFACGAGRWHPWQTNTT